MLSSLTFAFEHSLYVKEWSGTEKRPKPVGHEDLNEHWVGAGHLKIGDKIKQADGTTGVVANVITLQQTREMFNLTVSEAHTFYVGTDGWLVHNCNPYDIAKAGGRHSGWYKDALGKSDNELQSGIRSLDKQIAEHQAKIADPRSALPNWDKLDPRQQQGLV